MKLSFSFSKKAEPKRVVEALKATRPQAEEREAILSLEGGEVKIDGPAKLATLLTIPCKNPLEERARGTAAPGASSLEKLQQPLGEGEQRSGLLDLSKLSSEDAKAAQALLTDAAMGKAAGTAATPAAPAPKPILMRDGSRRAREGKDAEATKEMFEAVPVESFGEALLRGMGYDPERHATKPVFRDKLRDTHLGLGAQAMLPHEKAKAKGKGRGEPAKEEPAAKRVRKEDFWPVRGLVVQVLGDEPRLKDFAGLEAVVLGADEEKQLCSVKARVNGESRTLSEVALASLAPRVGKDCQQVKILRGPKRLSVAKLLARDRERRVAKVAADGEEAELPLEDVCQFMG